MSSDPLPADTGPESLEKKRPAEKGDTTEEPPTKRCQSENKNSQGASDQLDGTISATGKSKNAAGKPVLDLCDSIGLKPGDRIEVTWEVHLSTGAEASSAGEGAAAGTDGTPTPTETTESTVQRWWPATLLPPDGRTYTLTDEDREAEAASGAGGGGGGDAIVAIRALDYDPFPEGGFPERSVEDVCFLSDIDVFNLGSESRAHWRREGSSWEPSPEDDDLIGGESADIGDLLSLTARDMFSAEQYDALSESERAQAEAVVIETRTRLTERLTSQGRTTVTEQDYDQVRDDMLANIRAGLEKKGLRIADGDVIVQATNSDQCREQLRTILDGVLGAALAKTADRMRLLPAAQQAAAADKISSAKEKILQKMLEQCDPTSPDPVTITADHVKTLMAEIGREL